MAVNFAKLPELSLQVSGANPSLYRPKATDEAANLSRPYLAQPDQMTRRGGWRSISPSCRCGYRNHRPIAASQYTALCITQDNELIRILPAQRVV